MSMQKGDQEILMLKDKVSGKVQAQEEKLSHEKNQNIKLVNENLEALQKLQEMFELKD